MKKIILLALIMKIALGYAQVHKTENVIIVTLDGMRWQEVFGGVDSVILNNSNYTANKDDIKKLLWGNMKMREEKNCFLFYGQSLRLRDNYMVTRI